MTTRRKCPRCGAEVPAGARFYCSRRCAADGMYRTEQAAKNKPKPRDKS